MTKTVLSAIICVVAGFLLGYAFRANHASRPKDMPLPTQWYALESVAHDTGDISPPMPTRDDAFPGDDHEEADVSALRTQGAQLAEAQIAFVAEGNQALPSSPSSAKAPPLPADARTIAVPVRLVPQFDIAAIGDDYKIHADIGEILRISETEKRQIENSLVEARARLEVLELQNSTVESLTDTSATLTIAPFEPEGEAVQNKLNGDIRAVLGDERASVFLDFFDRNTTREVFNLFGQVGQKVTVTAGEDGKFTVNSEYEVVTPGSTFLRRYTRRGQEELPANFRHLFDVQ